MTVLCSAATEPGLDGGFGQYAEKIRRQWLFLPLNLVQHQRPMFVGSQPLSTTRCAAWFRLNNAEPPHWRLSRGGDTLLFVKFRWLVSHHSLVLIYNLSCSPKSRQSTLVSATPNMSKLYTFIPFLSKSSFTLFPWVDNPPMFKKPHRNTFFFLTHILSPKSSIEEVWSPLNSSATRGTEELALRLGTGTGGYRKTASGCHWIWVVSRVIQRGRGLP